ncbi:hypothetical protein ON010_g10762 [Phytophthora cinnamomi]|nr:hypothetical protein ON010_g10762 [Phytophthora cinnamomi]
MVSLTSIATAAAFAVAGFLASPADGAIAACATAPSNPGDRRANKSQLKVATFNAEFLFLGTETHTLVCPGADCTWTTAAQAQSHIQQIATVVKALNADILHLNEVEDCTVLEAVITQLEALGDSTYVGYLVRGTDTSTGQNAALLTRVDPVVDLKRSTATASIPVSGSTCLSASGFSSTKGVSKHFYTTFNVPVAMSAKRRPQYSLV